MPQLMNQCALKLGDAGSRGHCMFVQYLVRGGIVTLDAAKCSGVVAGLALLRSAQHDGQRVA